MRITKFKKKWYVVFEDEYDAWEWEWLFVGILRMKYTCYGGYFNAFTWKGKKDA